MTAHYHQSDRGFVYQQGETACHCMYQERCKWYLDVEDRRLIAENGSLPAYLDTTASNVDSLLSSIRLHTSDLRQGTYEGWGHQTSQEEIERAANADHDPY